MSPVDRACSVSAISPRHSSLQKIRCVHMRRRASPVTLISVTELEFFQCKHSSPDTGTVRVETFSTAHGL